ncbi:hypothetical protein WA158_008141 [Blastocystis sp. Blastoise]
MLVYHDIFGKCELVSDSFPSTEDDLLLNVEAKLVEKEDCEDDAVPEQILDVVQNHKYKTFTSLMKKYVKQVRGYLKENNPEREKAFVEGMNNYIAAVLKAFKEYDFYHGTVDYDAIEDIYYDLAEQKEKATAEGKDPATITHPQEMIVICSYEDGVKPIFHFFKDGMIAEKY